MHPLEKFKDFRPPGPVAHAFMEDRVSKVRALRGPVGGGKTVTCIFDCLKSASEMPICKNGEIHYMVAILGATYAQLEKNLYETWHRWLPANGINDDNVRWTEAEWSGGGGRYATHRLAWKVPHWDYGGRLIKVNFKAMFSAIGEQSVEQFMRGFEPTRFWLFELDLHSRKALEFALTRLGRFPQRADMYQDKPYRSDIIADLNSPDVDSWFYKMFEEEKQAPAHPVPGGFAHYAQPSALSPQAENLHNLQPDYYTSQVASIGSNKALLKRMVMNQYAPSYAGQPVFPEYMDEIHLSPDELKPIKGQPILLGLDQGITSPAAVIMQPAPNRQLRVLGEVAIGRAGTASFCEAVRRELAAVAPGFDVRGGWCDLAGLAGEVPEDNQLSWLQQVVAELGVAIQPAWTNAISTRLDVVRDELVTMLPGGTPSLLLSRRCKILRKAFVSHYRFGKSVKDYGDKLTAKPDKSIQPWADVMDALQYVLLGIKGRQGVTHRKQARARLDGRATGAAAAAGCHTIANATDLWA